MVKRFNLFGRSVYIVVCLVTHRRVRFFVEVGPKTIFVTDFLAVNIPLILRLVFIFRDEDPMRKHVTYLELSEFPLTNNKVSIILLFDANALVKDSGCEHPVVNGHGFPLLNMVGKTIALRVRQVCHLSDINELFCEVVWTLKLF